MSVKTGITWAHSTFNPWWGCVKVSPGCANCYAEADSRRYGYDVWGPQAERRFFGDKHWNEPIKWNQKAAEAGERRRVFCASMADILEDRDDLGPYRKKLWALIEATPHLDWLLLTKRPENYLKMVPVAWVEGPWPRNAWAGFTAEDQPRLTERARFMRHVPAPIRWISAEPLLGPLDFSSYVDFNACGCTEPDCPVDPKDCPHCLGSMAISAFNWVVFGGEGIGRRVCNLEWIRDGVGQCRAGGMVPFVKQLGSNVVMDVPMAGEPDTVHQSNLKLAKWKGEDIDEWPEDLRVREFPKWAA